MGGLETLLEAARYIEMYEVEMNTRAGIPISIFEFGRSPQVTSTTFHPRRSSLSPSEMSTSDNSIESHEETTRRRSNSSSSSSNTNSSNASSKEIHNMLEKIRRATLKENFENLKGQLPFADEIKKASNLSILQRSFNYIKVLERKDSQFKSEKAKLDHEKAELKQRLSELKSGVMVDDEGSVKDHPGPKDEKKRALKRKNVSECVDEVLGYGRHHVHWKKIKTPANFETITFWKSDEVN